MVYIFLGWLFLFHLGSTGVKAASSTAQQDVDYVVTIIIASIAGGMVLMVIVILIVRCVCLKCKKTPVRNIRARGPPSYEDTRRPYRLPAPPAYSPRNYNYPSHPPPAYETHISLPGVTE
ncbi:uncharacterized protein [Mytilus edulis]|uniref:uncharacterized protein n=1 Tax=Mytilus edulis TaxID=6550 RepID=UPI0039EE4A77